MGKGAVAVVAAIIIAGGLFVGYPYYKDYLPFELEDIFGEEEVTTYAIEVVADGNGVTFGTGTYAEGEEYAIFAVADEGYVFIQWDDGNKDAERAMTASSDATHTAQFAKGYMVVLKSDTEDAAAFTGYGGYIVGDKATITVSANYGYEFISWSDGSTDTTRTLTVNSDIILTASFKTLPRRPSLLFRTTRPAVLSPGTGKLIIADSRDLVPRRITDTSSSMVMTQTISSLRNPAPIPVTAVTDGAVMTYYVDYPEGIVYCRSDTRNIRSCFGIGAKEYYPDETATINHQGSGKATHTPDSINGSTLLTSGIHIHIHCHGGCLIRGPHDRRPEMLRHDHPRSIRRYNTLTITERTIPTWSPPMTVTDTIFGDKITDCVGRSFTLDIEDGTAVSITHTLT